MTTILKSAADSVLQRVVSGTPSVPGVVAMATDRHSNIFEGAAGKRVLGEDADMTTDSVFAIFSTTKAITGTAALQLVEEGRLDLHTDVNRYLKGVQIPTTFPEPITLEHLMSHTPGFEDDVYGRASVREDGRVITPAYLFEVKRPEESRGPWDYYRLVATTAAEEAWRPLNEGGCPFVRST